MTGNVDIGLLAGLISAIVGAIIAVVKWLDARTNGIAKDMRSEFSLAKAELEKQLEELRLRVRHLEDNGRAARTKIREAQRFALEKDYEGALINLLDEAEALLP